MKSWFLFFLGTLAYYLNRYNGRKNKLPSFDFTFWVRDNWPELLLTFIFDLAAVIVLLDPVTAIDLTKITWFPTYLVLPVKLAGAFVVGYGGGLAIYAIFKRKVKDAKG